MNYKYYLIIEILGNTTTSRIGSTNDAIVALEAAQHLIWCAIAMTLLHLK